MIKKKNKYNGCKQNYEKMVFQNDFTTNTLVVIRGTKQHFQNKPSLKIQNNDNY